jgi:peptidyl-prolyl cis-trans isomerase C
MPNYKVILLGATLALGLNGATWAQSEATAATPEVTADTVVATVNGEKVTIGNLIASLDALDDRDKQLADDVLFKGLTERLIQQIAVGRSVETLSKSVELKLENQRRSLIASEIVDGLASKIIVDDAAIQAAYDARFSEFTPAKEYNASHILVMTEDEAKAIIADLEAGADFAEQAKEKSTGPSGPSGGNLGWFTADKMVPDFQAAVEKLDVGAISAPVQTQFGWHVIKLNDTRIPSAPKLDDVKAQLQTELFREQLFAQIEAMLSSADIVREDVTGIDPAVLRDLSLIGK